MDKFKVDIHPRDTGELPSSLELERVQGVINEDWSEDVGVGKAILLEVGREVVNPVPHAPPLGYRPEPSIMEMVDAMVKRRLAELGDDDVIDENLQEAEDFEVPDDMDPSSPYEIQLISEFPAMPRNVPAERDDDRSGLDEEPEPEAPAPKPVKSLKHLLLTLPILIRTLFRIRTTNNTTKQRRRRTDQFT